MSSYYVQVHSGNFNTIVLQSKVPVILEFGAAWCGTCHILDPVLKKISMLFKNRICIGKLDQDQDMDLFAHYGIHNIPTVLIFFHGKIVDSFFGALPQEKIVQKLQLLLLDAS